MSVLDLVSSFVGGNSKMMSALKQAVEIANSGKYTPDLKGALALARDYGFDDNAFRKMKELSENKQLLSILGTVSPGSAQSLQNMLSQLSTAYLSQSRFNTNSSMTPNAAKKSVNDSERFNARLNALDIPMSH